MSIRISIYAVELPALETFLEQPLGTVLEYYAEYGEHPEKGMLAWDPSTKARYYSVPNAVFRCGDERVPREVGHASEEWNCRPKTYTQTHF